MRTSTKAATLLLATSLGLLGCPSDDDTTSDTQNDSGSESSTSPTTTTTMSTTQPTTTIEPTSTSPDSSGSESSSATSESSSSSTGDPTVFEFLPNGPEDYAQVDRKGFPAVNTGLNLLGDKDAYNSGSPVDDANGDFVQNELDSLIALHIGAPGMQVPLDTGLDDELASLAFVPCNPPGEIGNPDCEDQALPLVQPDTLDIHADDPAGFPNGRLLDDQAIDIILAVLMLNLDVHGADAFAMLPVNPPANDVMTSAEFPFLAAPN